LLNEKKTSFQRQHKELPLSRQSIEALDISKTFVQRFQNKDTLAEFIRCIRPISGYSEIEFADNVIKERKIDLMQQFFYTFWESRNPKDPEAAWLTYKEDVIKVNQEFRTFGMKGYDTDRGRVYLQYGPPDSRNSITSEPSAYPYEIWQYNTLVNKSLILSSPYNRQSNKKFVFYNPDLVTNKYRLIHSDARGEIQDARWEILVYKRTTNSQNLDEEKVTDPGFGGNVNDNFQNPK
jgi:GWxTD domain-containing protein